MKTDLRPYAIALLATVYAVAFWVFQARAPRDDAPAVNAPARAEVRIPPGWTVAQAGDPPPSTRVAPARARRIRTRSS